MFYFYVFPSLFGLRKILRKVYSLLLGILLFSQIMFNLEIIWFLFLKVVLVYDKFFFSVKTGRILAVSVLVSNWSRIDC